MKLQVLIPFAVSLMVFGGCGQHSAKIPQGSFRVSVTDVFSSEDERVALVTVETSNSQRYSVRAKSVHLGDGSMKRVADTGLYRERVLTFVSSRISPNGSAHDYIKAILKRGEQVVTTDAREFPRETPLGREVALTVRDGIYPLSKALVIGRLYGEDLLLTVGDTSMETAKQ
jgi:hypothetical protein